ncbi:hypothetical protein LH417_15150, partial [Laribacter hongkongensis]|nr:hypothetical protein [Laribacter hongkongensis]
MKQPTKKSFLAELAQLAAGYRRQIEAEVDGFDPDPARRLERRQRALDPVAGYGFFVATYFPHYVRHPDQSELHRYLFSRLPQIVAAPGSESDAIAAPRGEAKSTLV